MRPFKVISAPVAAGLIVGSLLGFSLGSLFVTQASRDTVRLVEDRHGITQAMALTEVVAAIESGKTGEDRAFGEAIKIWTQAHPDVREVRVVRLSGARLLASTEKGDAARGRLPRRLTRDEKWLFDLGQRLRIARETNRDEGASRKKEIELNQLPGNLLQVSAPYLLHGDVVGFVQLKLQKPGLNMVTGRGAAALSVLAVIALYLMTVMLLRQNRFMTPAGQGRSPGQLAVAAALLILGFLIFAATQFTVLDAQRRSLEQRLAGQYASVRTTVDDIDRTLNLPHSPPGENRWDVDEYRRPYRFTDGQGRLRTDALAAARSSQARELRRSLEGGGAVALFLLLFFGTGWARRLRETLTENREAYLYVSPAIVGMLILVFFPFLYGIALSFTDANIYNTGAHLKEIWIGFTNYLSILGDMDVFVRSGSTWIVNYQNFYWTLYITIAWTIVNVAIGVSVGLLLALILNTKGLGMRTVYRVLLILPWAIPNYITALIWRGMFHKQFGVINQVIQIFGGEPVAWFDGVFTSFITGVATNGWLSFPFMMVMCLGGLQSISQEMYEAARLDGASRWQQFRYITLPSLKPVLIPAIVISVVWTFNMFNIIFLVSGGEPAGSNEILITEAYKIAFEQYRYGYAAAYSTIIFVILFVYGIFQIRMTKATEANI